MLSCVTPVTGGNTTTCAAAPAFGVNTQSISGCSGSPTSDGVNGYTTNIVAANCTVSATFVAVGSLTDTGTASPLVGRSVTSTPTSVANGCNASCTASANPGFTFTRLAATAWVHRAT